MAITNYQVKYLLRHCTQVLGVILILMGTTSMARDLPGAKPANSGVSAERLARLDAAMQTEIDEHKKAGIIVLLARHGKVVHYKAYGMANIEAGKPMQKDSLVRLYSMTKPLTSVALLTLYEQGKFQLTDTLDKYIPEMKDLQVFTGENAYGVMTTEEPGRKPTIQDVFRHTAGFAYGNGTSPVDLLYQQNGIGYDTSSSLKEMVTERLPRMPLLYQPGKRWVYSVSHDVQAYLVEYFSGMPYAEYLQKTILDPLDMKDTYFGVPENIVDRYTANYGPGEKGELTQIENQNGNRPRGESGSYSRYTDIPFGGSGLSATAMDYAKFAQMLLNGGELNGVRILGSKTVELMTMNHLPANIGYLTGPSAGGGYGLGVSVLADQAVAGNLGSVGQFGWGGAASTKVIMDPEEDMVAIFLTQYMPSEFSIINKWQTLVYQSIVE